MRELNVTNERGSPLLNRYNAIQCSRCGIVASTHEGLHLGRMLVAICEKLGIPTA